MTPKFFRAISRQEQAKKAAPLLGPLLDAVEVETESHKPYHRVPCPCPLCKAYRAYRAEEKPGWQKGTEALHKAEEEDRQDVEAAKEAIEDMEAKGQKPVPLEEVKKRRGRWLGPMPE